MLLFGQNFVPKGGKKFFSPKKIILPLGAAYITCMHNMQNKVHNMHVHHLRHTFICHCL